MEALQITWEKLFDKNFQSLLIKKMDENLLNKYIHPEDGKTEDGKPSIRKQKIIVRMILPEKYRLMPSGKDFTDEMTPSEFSRYFKYSHNYGFKYYEFVKNKILTDGQSGKYNFYSLPFIKDLKENLKQLLSPLSNNEFNNYKSKITDYMNNLNTYVKDLSKSEQLQPLWHTLDFNDQLACLTAIAATRYCLDCSDNTPKDLIHFLVPFSEVDSKNTEWTEKYISNQEKEAKNKFNDAEEAFKNGNFSDAISMFQKVTEYNFAKDNILGKAYYYLALCYLEHKNSLKDHSDTKNRLNAASKKSPKELFKKATDYGNQDAAIYLKKMFGKPELLRLLRPISETHGTARIVTNCMNKYVDELIKTLPKEMKKKEVREEMFVTANTQKAFEDILQANRNSDCRFLLFDESSEKNFQDLLFILDKILLTPVENDSTTSLHWFETVIYIRVSEDRYSALIDTALKRLGDYTVRVFIIDDNKWPVQYLLNKHPLFEPILRIPASRLNNRPIIMNLTVISHNSEAFAQWVIREAYWLGCFHYASLKLSLNLISPDAEKIENKLRFDCPGIFDNLSESDCKPIVLNNNNFKTVPDLSSPTALAEIETLYEKPNTYNYFIIHTGNDIDNLNYGIKLREWSIKKILDSGKTPQKYNLPLIAFYCQNSDIAYLSERLVVQAVDCGNQWFNNYNLIPFGTLCDRYSWTTLDGGYLEKVAQSTHLQYCGADIHAPLEEKIRHLKDYFSRCYNRDSSMAVALSMPYRLYQTAYGPNGHIIPSPPYTYDLLSPDSIREMAEKFEEVKLYSENKENLLKYEHSRWMFWAISRGWIKADPQTVLSYMKAGSPKHLLYIARMHGCITSRDGLENLATAMSEYASEASADEAEKYTDEKAPKDFIAYDKKSIDQTADIITTAWFEDFISQKEPEK